MPTASHAPLNLTRLALTTITEKQGRDAVAYDVRKRSMLTDYVIIATGQNGPHMKALCSEIRIRFKELGLPCFRQSGDTDSGWIMADYFDVVVHLFLPDPRAYYALDELMGDAARVK